MPRFDFIKEITAADTFKVEQVKGAFDLQTSTIQEHFTGDIAIEGKDWNIGLIVGRSGTGIKNRDVNAISCRLATPGF